MSRAFRSSTDFGHRCAGDGDRHVHDHALIERRHELAGQRLHRLVGDQGHHQQARRGEHGGQSASRQKAVATMARNKVARKTGRLPSGARPRRNVTPSTHASAAGRSIRYDRTGR